MKATLAVLIIALIGFCGLLVYEGHWIAGTILVVIIMCSIKVQWGDK